MWFRRRWPSIKKMRQILRTYNFNMIVCQTHPTHIFVKLLTKIDFYRPPLFRSTVHINIVPGLKLIEIPPSQPVMCWLYVRPMCFDVGPTLPQPRFNVWRSLEHRPAPASANRAA